MSNFPSFRRWAILAAAAAISLSAVLLEIRGARRVGIRGTDLVLPETCTFHRLSGLDCPGCGLTRSFVSMAHGDVRSAFRYHPLGVFLFSLVLWQIPWQAAQLVREYRGLSPWRVGRSGWRPVVTCCALFAVVYLAFGIGRVMWQIVAR